MGLILTVSSLILNGLMKGAPVDELCNKAIVYVLIQIVILLLTILGMRVFLLLRYDRSGKRKNYK